MVKVQFIKDLKPNKKGDKSEMYESTAKALVNAKVVKILKETQKETTENK